METPPRSDLEETTSAGISCGILPLDRHFGKARRGHQTVAASAPDKLLLRYMKKKTQWKTQFNIAYS